MRTPVLKNVDVVATLKAILDANTTSFKSDFDYDVKTLKAVAKNPESKKRSFFLDEPPLRNLAFQGIRYLPSRLCRL